MPCVGPESVGGQIVQYAQRLVPTAKPACDPETTGLPGRSSWKQNHPAEQHPSSAKHRSLSNPSVPVGKTPNIHQLVSDTAAEIVNALLNAGTYVDARNEDDRTSLHLAAKSEYGTAEIVNALPNAGANVNARDGEGKTPLYLAARDGTAEAANALQAAGAR